MRFLPTRTNQLVELFPQNVWYAARLQGKSERRVTGWNVCRSHVVILEDDEAGELIRRSSSTLFAPISGI
jgi:hypothetical protein